MRSKPYEKRHHLAVSERSELRDILGIDVLAGAKKLIGWELVRGTRRARIVETEAYRYADDPACHAFGRTQMKNMAMFGPPGHAYVYLCYGMHWMLNVVAHGPGDGSAVLIRAAEPLAGFETSEILPVGPGRLGKAFGISPADNDIDLLDPASDLRIEPGTPPKDFLIGPRVGLALNKAPDLLWRFADANRLKWISKPRISSG